MSISQNIRYLRKQLGLTQSDLAERLGLKRPAIGAYEEGRAEPRLHTLVHISSFFEVSVDALLSTDLSTGEFQSDSSGKSLRILPIAIDSNADAERATLVSSKAAEGYLSGFGDRDFIESLPSFLIPFPELHTDKTYRVFQIEGESMLPIPPGAYIISEYVQNWDDLKTDERYIFLTKDEGVVFKRVRIHPHNRSYELISDNADFKPYFIKQAHVLEVWKARGLMSFDLDSFRGSGNTDMKTVMEAIARMEKKL